MMARSNETHPEAGYIDARPPTPAPRNPLATHGWTIHPGQSRLSGPMPSMSAKVSKADIGQQAAEVAEVPCVDGAPLARVFLTFAAGSVRPCVRPTCAVLMTAGHNALRESGPGQQLAFDHAMAHVGCPDRRIDRHCITCCSPLPTFRSRRCRRDFGYTASVAGSL